MEILSIVWGTVLIVLGIACIVKRGFASKLMPFIAKIIFGIFLLIIGILFAKNYVFPMITESQEQKDQEKKRVIEYYNNGYDVFCDGVQVENIQSINIEDYEIEFNKEQEAVYLVTSDNGNLTNAVIIAIAIAMSIALVRRREETA